MGFVIVEEIGDRAWERRIGSGYVCVGEKEREGVCVCVWERERKRSVRRRRSRKITPSQAKSTNASRLCVLPTRDPARRRTNHRTRHDTPDGPMFILRGGPNSTHSPSHATGGADSLRRTPQSGHIYKASQEPHRGEELVRIEVGSRRFDLLLAADLDMGTKRGERVGRKGPGEEAASGNPAMVGEQGRGGWVVRGVGPSKRWVRRGANGGTSKDRNTARRSTDTAGSSTKLVRKERESQKKETVTLRETASDSILHAASGLSSFSLHGPGLSLPPFLFHSSILCIPHPRILFGPFPFTLVHSSRSFASLAFLFIPSSLHLFICIHHEPRYLPRSFGVLHCSSLIEMST